MPGFALVILGLALTAAVFVWLVRSAPTALRETRDDMRRNPL